MTMDDAPPGATLRISGHDDGCVLVDLIGSDGQGNRIRCSRIITPTEMRHASILGVLRFAVSDLKMEMSQDAGVAHCIARVGVEGSQAWMQKYDHLYIDQLISIIRSWDGHVRSGEE